MIAKCLLRQKTSKTFTFDYFVPVGLSVQRYSLVEVPFMQKKVEAVVVDLVNSSVFAKRPVSRKLSMGPVITSAQHDIAGLIAKEFFSSMPSAIFSFLPELNKKDLKILGKKSSPRKLKKTQKPIILTADFEFRLNYYFGKLNKEKQNLIVLPKIEDLIQAEKILKKLDPSIKTLLWHSQLNSKQKAVAWQELITGKPAVVFATRHGLFLPFVKLNSISIDDPGNFAYFEDQEPKYNAQVASKIVSSVYGCPLIFGDSLPSLEAYAWIKSGKAIQIKQQNKLKIIRTLDLSNIFSDENFVAKLKKSKRILLTGFFTNSEKFYCLNCGNVALSTAPNASVCDKCASIKIKKGLLDINESKLSAEKIFEKKVSTDPLSKEEIVIIPFSKIRLTQKTFDIAIVLHFDLYATFPYLNFEYKLLKSILDLKQAGVDTVFLCSRKTSRLTDCLEENKFDNFFLEELRNRRSENMPPFTRILEFTGNKDSLNKLESIIKQESWFGGRRRLYSLLSHTEIKKLQDIYTQRGMILKLRVDPPEFT